MKLLIISLRTTGLLKEMFEEYCLEWSKMAEVYCITNDNVELSFLDIGRVLNLHYRRKEPLSYFSIEKIKRAKEFMDNIKPSIILFFTPHPDNIFLVKYAAKYPVVCQIHNPLPHSGTKITERIISAIQKKLYFKYCKRIFVAGESLKNDLVQHYGIAEDRIYSHKFAALSNIPQIPKTAGNEKYDVIFFGRIEPYKGINVLIDSLKFTHHCRTVLIVGKGKPYFSTVSDQAEITFVNEYVPDDKLAVLIAESKMVVMPYLDATGTSTVIQAFSFGKPVIATNVGVFPEYVAEGGIIIQPNNPKQLAKAIDKLIENDELRVNIGKFGNKKLKSDFDIITFCKDYIIEFEKVIKNNGEICSGKKASI